MDQVEEMQLMAFEKALERVGSYFIIGAVQPPPLIIITVNPTPTWVKALVYDRWMNKTLPTDWIYIPSKITDNPHVPESFKQSLLELKKVNPIKYKRFVEGDWDIQDNIEGAFYKDFDYEKQVGSTTEDLSVYYDSELPLHISFDFNVNPYMTLIVCQIDIDNDEILEEGQPRRKKLNILQEFCMVSPKNTTEATCKAFARVYSEHVGGVFIYGDPAGKHEDTRSEKGYNDYTIIKKELVRFHPRMKVATSAPSVVMRGSFINTIFRNQPFKEDSKTVGYKGITVHVDEDCTNMIKDFTNQLEDADGKKLKSKKTDPLTKVRSEEFGHCFVGDTLITTNKGDVQIKDIKVGDMVLTRQGFKEVYRSGLTRKNALVKTYNICGNEITCTPNHKIFTYNDGFKFAHDLIRTDTFCILQEKNTWNKNTLYSILLNSTDHWEVLGVTEFTTLGGKKEIHAKSTYTDTLGSSIMGKFLKVKRYTTLTKTHSITTLQTFSALRENSIWSYTKKITGCIHKKVKNILLKCKTWLRIGTGQRMVVNGIQNTLITQYSKKKEQFFVLSAEQLKQQGSLSKLSTAQVDAKAGLTQGYGERENVYDLSVKDCPEFFANNVLVHNCGDAFDYLACEVFKKEYRLYQRGGGEEMTEYHIPATSSKKF